MDQDAKPGTSEVHSNEGVTLTDVRRALEAGKLLASVLTPDELRAMVAENGGDVAKRNQTGTGFAITHRSRQLPAIKAS